MILSISILQYPHNITQGFHSTAS